MAPDVFNLGCRLQIFDISGPCHSNGRSPPCQHMGNSSWQNAVQGSVIDNCNPMLQRESRIAIARLHTHPLSLQAPLPKALDERIKVWFSSINRNSGQSLTAKDVAKALEMGGITSDKHSVMQLIQSIDLDNSGTIELHEFEVSAEDFHPLHYVPRIVSHGGHAAYGHGHAGLHT